MTAESTYPLVLTPETIQTFRDKGYVLTENVFETLELARHATGVDREVANRTSTDKRSIHEKSAYEQSFIQCMRLWETSSDVRPLTFHAGLAGIAAQLLGVSSVRLWQDQALYKEPGGRETRLSGQSARYRLSVPGYPLMPFKDQMVRCPTCLVPIRLGRCVLLILPIQQSRIIYSPIQR
jgi:hypothetical protein